MKIFLFSSCHSTVRTAMMKHDLVNFSQEFIDTHYMEFSIPSRENEVIHRDHCLYFF